jgi:hypothetical protein
LPCHPLDSTWLTVSWSEKMPLRANELVPVFAVYWIFPVFFSLKEQFGADLPRVELEVDCHLSTLSRTAEIHLSFKHMRSISTIAATLSFLDRRKETFLFFLLSFLDRIQNWSKLCVYSSLFSWPNTKLVKLVKLF